MDMPLCGELEIFIPPCIGCARNYVDVYNKYKEETEKNYPELGKALKKQLDISRKPYKCP